MSKYRTKSTYFCPYCNLAGWQKLGDLKAHVRKSHPNKAKELDSKKSHRYSGKGAFANMNHWAIKMRQEEFLKRIW